MHLVVAARKGPLIIVTQLTPLVVNQYNNCKKFIAIFMIANF